MPGAAVPAQKKDGVFPPSSVLFGIAISPYHITIKPSTIELIRKNLFELLLKNKIVTITKAARPRFSKEPKVPFDIAPKPPAQEITPTLIKLKPIKVTTTPDTNGVMIFLV